MIHRIHTRVIAGVDVRCEEILCAAVPFVDADSLDSLGKVGRNELAIRIAGWGRDRSRRSSEDLTLELLRTTSDGRVFWLATDEAVRRKYKTAAQIIVDRFDEFPDYQHWLIANLCHLDSPEALSTARKTVGRALDPYVGNVARASMDAWSRDSTVFYAALILLRHGDKAAREGFDDLKRVFAVDYSGHFIQMAEKDLLALNTDEAQNILCSAVQKNGFEFWSDGEQFAKRLFRMGCREVLDYLLIQLDNRQPTGLHIRTDDNRAVITHSSIRADHVARQLAEWRPGGPAYMMDVMPEEEKTVFREDLKAWLRDQFAIIEAGETPDLR